MGKKSTSKRDYLYLCDSTRRIADHECNGLGCMIFGECSHTLDAKYAIPSNDRLFEYYCETDENGEVTKEYYFEIEKESIS